MHTLEVVEINSNNMKKLIVLIGIIFLFSCQKETTYNPITYQQVKHNSKTAVIPPQNVQVDFDMQGKFKHFTITWETATYDYFLIYRNGVAWLSVYECEYTESFRMPLTPITFEIFTSLNGEMSEGVTIIAER